MSHSLLHQPSQRGSLPVMGHLPVMLTCTMGKIIAVRDRAGKAAVDRIRWKVLGLTLLAGVFGCVLPGTTSPTPFVFPTPNLTLTAIQERIDSGTPPADEATSAPTATPTELATEGAPTAFPTAAPEGGIRENGSPLTALPLSEPPTVDGDLAGWPADRSSISEVVYGASNWTGGSDTSASFVLGWDSANLYLGARVNDDAFVQTSSGRTLFRGDSLELLLDTSLAADFDSSNLSLDDFQIGLSPGDFNGRAAEAYRWFPRSQEASLSSPVVASQRAEDGYVVEASLPWSVFGLVPEAGDCFGFALSVSDNDLAGTAVQQTMVSSVATRSLTDPTSWGTLILGGGVACRTASSEG